MKKLAALLLAAAGTIWAVRRSRADQAEADLWAEATDSVDPAGAPPARRSPHPGT